MTAFTDLMAFQCDTEALAQIAGRLGWDQETMMPRGASAQRGDEMAAIKAVLHVRRTDPLLRSKVASGLYTSASEVVREALRLKAERDRLRRAKLDQLRGDVRQGLASGSSEAWDAEAVKRKARARRASKPTVA